MVEVRTVSGVVARGLSGLNVDLPVISRIGFENNEPIALGGLAFGGGRTWLWFHVEPSAPKNILRQALAECEAMKRRAVQFGATEVYTPRDANYPTSERLLKLAGFEKTEEIIDEKEIWRWQHSER